MLFGYIFGTTRGYLLEVWAEKYLGCEEDFLFTLDAHSQKHLWVIVLYYSEQDTNFIDVFILTGGLS